MSNLTRWTDDPKALAEAKTHDDRTAVDRFLTSPDAVCATVLLVIIGMGLGFGAGIGLAVEGGHIIAGIVLALTSGVVGTRGALHLLLRGDRAIEEFEAQKALALDRVSVKVPDHLAVLADEIRDVVDVSEGAPEWAHEAVALLPGLMRDIAEHHTHDTTESESYRTAVETLDALHTRVTGWQQARQEAEDAGRIAALNEATPQSPAAELIQEVLSTTAPALNEAR